MLAARAYGVNVLAREQEHLSNRFSKALADKWANVDHTLGHGEARCSPALWPISNASPTPITMAATM